MISPWAMLPLLVAAILAWWPWFLAALTLLLGVELFT